MELAPLERQTFLALLLAQEFPQIEKEPPPKRLPDGTLQSDAILKEDLKRNLADLAKLQTLAKEVEEELKKFGPHVLSTSIVKKLEEIEKTARRVRTRHNR